MRKLIYFFAASGFLLTVCFASYHAFASNSINTGGNHTCAVQNGKAKCWGDNSKGQLGNSTLIDSLVPVQVTGLTSGVLMIAAGNKHSCAIVGSEAKCWGQNNKGQLGNNSKTASSVPVGVSGLSSGVSFIAVDDDYSCAVVNEGLKCWGEGTAEKPDSHHVKKSLVPVDVAGLTTGVSHVDLGNHTTCVVQNGAALCFGSDKNLTGKKNKLSQITGLTSGVTRVTVGAHHACAVMNGAAYCWGQNGQGQLGNGTTTKSLVPVLVAGFTTASIIQDIRAGDAHTCLSAVTIPMNRSGMFCFGKDNQGQLGDDLVKMQKHVPTPVYEMSAGVEQITADGTVTCVIIDGGGYCWGKNNQGQLGIGSTISSLIPVAVSGYPRVPTNLSYLNPAGIYYVGTQILENFPSSLGGVVSSYKISPDLSLGLAINSSTGVISGNPQVVSALTSYTATAANDSGDDKCYNSIWRSTPLAMFSTTSFVSSFGPCSAIGMREQRELFIASSANNLMIDSARGGGEYLMTLAVLSGCHDATTRKQFFSAVQKNFGEIYLRKIDSSEVIAKHIDENKLGTSNAPFFAVKDDKITQVNIGQVPSRIDMLISSDGDHDDRKRSGYPVHSSDLGAQKPLNDDIYTHVGIRKIKEVHMAKHPGAAIKPVKSL